MNSNSVLTLTIVCKECDFMHKSHIYITKRNASAIDIEYAKLRSRLNADLNYYVTSFNGTDSEIISFAKAKGLREPCFIEL